MSLHVTVVSVVFAREVGDLRGRLGEGGSPVDFQYRGPLAQVDAFFPPRLQVIVFGYLGIVLMRWSMDTLSERRGLLLFVIYIAAAVFFTAKASSVLLTLLTRP